MSNENDVRIIHVAAKFSEIFSRHTGLTIKGPCLDEAREILIAADEAAWCFDMEKAPRNKEVMILVVGLYSEPFITKAQWDRDRHAKRPVPRWASSDRCYSWGESKTHPPIAWKPITAPSIRGGIEMTKPNPTERPR